MKVTVDLPERVVEALLAWNLPEEFCGPSIEERLCFLASETAESLQSVKRRAQLRNMFGLAPDDDDVPL